METPTPETDAAIAYLNSDAFWDSEQNEATYLLGLLAKLERERDEARREAEAAWDCKWPKPSWSWRQ